MPGVEIISIHVTGTEADAFEMSVVKIKTRCVSVMVHNVFSTMRGELII